VLCAAMKLCLLFSIFFVALANKEAFNEALATQWMSYAGVAYCTIEWRHVEVESWTCHTCVTLPYMNATVFHSVDDNTCGYVGYDPKNRFIMVAFSGTDPLNIRDWIDDIDYVQVDFPYCKNCKVHKGFYDSYLSVQSQVLDLVKKWRVVDPTAPVMVTGHSLGAALTVHGAIDMILSLKITPMALYDYGQPRTGNKNFTDWYTTQIPTHWRVTHNKDPVPQLPEEFMTQDGYFHNVQETWYNQDNSQYTLCNSTFGEDPTCSDSQLDYRVEDHLTYMNFDVTANYLTCRL